MQQMSLLSSENKASFFNEMRQKNIIQLKSQALFSGKLDNKTTPVSPEVKNR